MNCVVKLSNNSSWYFYYDSSNGICFSKLNSKGEMQDSGILSPDSPNDFDVICDENDVIHMCCQNNNGDIVYFRCRDNIWNKTTLLKSKSGSTKDKSFHLFSINGWINLLYVLEYRGKNMLTHHIPERNNGEPEVVDYIGKSYTAATDKSGNIYVYYDSETNSAFGYKMYRWSQKNWCDFTQAPRYDNCDTLLTMFDNSNNPRAISAKSKEIHVMSDGNDTIISTGERPVLLSLSNSVIAQWLYRGSIYSAISVNGSSFNKCGAYPLNKRLVPELYRISHISNNISAEYCYGYRSGDKIILYELENLCFGCDEQMEQLADVFSSDNTKTDNNIVSAVQNYNNDYQMLYNKTTEALTSINNKLESVENQLQSLNAHLTEIENIIKEPPEGSSKKRKIIRG